MCISSGVAEEQGVVARALCTCGSKQARPTARTNRSNSISVPIQSEGSALAPTRINFLLNRPFSSPLAAMLAYPGLGRPNGLLNSIELNSNQSQASRRLDLLVKASRPEALVLIWKGHRLRGSIDQNAQGPKSKGCETIDRRTGGRRCRSPSTGGPAAAGGRERQRTNDSG